MANAILLQELLRDSGKTKSHVASKAKVSRPRLDNILEHPETATYGQADAISRELSMKADVRNEIFLP